MSREMTTLESHPSIIVEKCCPDADVFRTIREWGVQWADGVRHWNYGGTVKCECSECGKELRWEIINESEATE